MKTLSRLLTLSCVSTTLLILAACSKAPVAPYGSPGSPGASDATDIEYTQPVYSEDTGPRVESLESPPEGEYPGGQYGAAGDPESDEYKRTHGRSSEQMMPIYFDFDQASIRSDQFSRLEQNGSYMADNPSSRVIIQGNCDERGTNEYNLALGERRALNAKTYLIELGIEEHRIRTVSYGEERPLFTEQDEFSWSQNRRDDFVLE